MAEQPKLKQELRGFQIFANPKPSQFIVISVVIGGGIFNGNGESLEVAGPAGLILSVVAVGFVAIFVSECTSEFTQQFAAPNALVEYVKTFVDEDLGWVVGIAYWYAFASVFAIQNLAAAELSKYWGLTQTFQTLAFYAVAPAIILLLNLLGVFYYGIVETIGGALKCILLFGLSILLYIIAAQQHDGSSNGPINDGFKNDSLFAANPSEAACFSIPIVAFSFYGIEIVTVTAFEAKTSRSLKFATQTIAYAVFLLYFLCTIGETLTVGWRTSHLPMIYGGIANSSSTTGGPIAPPNSTSLAVNAVWAAGYHNLAGFLNACLIFSVLSASNTSLYVSSRILYGLARDIPVTNWFGRQLSYLSRVVRKTGVPAPALVFSAVSFFWLPFLQLKAGYAIQDLIEIMSLSASVSCLIAWACLCIAFIRYELWLKICDDALKRRYKYYRRESPEYSPDTFLSWAQPWIAWWGFIGCLLVFGFSSATWWNSQASFAKVAAAYAVHVLLFGLFVLFKLFKLKKRRLWVQLSSDETVLVAQLDRLRWLKEDQQPAGEESVQESAAQHLAPSNGCIIGGVERNERVGRESGGIMGS